MNTMTVFVLALFFAMTAAQSASQLCDLCKLMIDDVKDNKSNDIDSMTVMALEEEMFTECDKYVPMPAFQVQNGICRSMIKDNEVGLLQALQQGVPALDCCKAVKLCQ